VCVSGRTGEHADEVEEEHSGELPSEGCGTRPEPTCELELVHSRTRSGQKRLTKRELDGVSRERRNSLPGGRKRNC
jgi:hypothetical protein